MWRRSTVFVIAIAMLSSSRSFSQDAKDNPFIINSLSRFEKTDSLYVKASGKIVYSPGYFGQKGDPQGDGTEFATDVPEASFESPIKIEIAYDSKSKSFMCSTIYVACNAESAKMHPVSVISCVKSLDSWDRIVFGEPTDDIRTFTAESRPASLSFHVLPSNLESLILPRHHAILFSAGNLLLNQQDRNSIFENTIDKWNVEVLHSKENEQILQLTPENKGHFRQVFTTKENGITTTTVKQYYDNELYIAYTVNYKEAESGDFVLSDYSFEHHSTGTRVLSGKLKIDKYERNQLLPKDIFEPLLLTGDALNYFDKATGMLAKQLEKMADGSLKQNYSRDDANRLQSQTSRENATGANNSSIFNGKFYTCAVLLFLPFAFYFYSRNK
jgi:hypothetical protein